VFCTHNRGCSCPPLQLISSCQSYLANATTSLPPLLTLPRPHTPSPQSSPTPALLQCHACATRSCCNTPSYSTWCVHSSWMGTALLPITRIPCVHCDGCMNECTSRLSPWTPHAHAPIRRPSVPRCQSKSPCACKTSMPGAIHACMRACSHASITARPKNKPGYKHATLPWQRHHTVLIITSPALRASRARSVKTGLSRHHRQPARREEADARLARLRRQHAGCGGGITSHC